MPSDAPLLLPLFLFPLSVFPHSLSRLRNPVLTRWPIILKRRQPLPAIFAKVTLVESTPSPDAFKLSLDEVLPVRSEEEKEERKRGKTFRGSQAFDLLVAPEAVKGVLELDGVESVLVSTDWITVTKRAKASWGDLLEKVITSIGGASPTLVLPDAPRAGNKESEGKEGGLEGGIKMRLQVSNGIPIQVEATCISDGTSKRYKLSGRFEEAIADFLKIPGNEQSFFQGRKWLNKGIRYETTDIDDSITQMASEVEEMYPAYRLRALVEDDKSLITGSTGDSLDLFREVGSVPDPELVDVDRVAVEAENHEDENVRVGAVAALVKLVQKGHGNRNVRRHAIASLGLLGDDKVSDSALSLIVDTLSLALQNEPAPFLRRTAGDALNDLGDPRGIPAARRALGDPSKLVRWRAAHILGEVEGGGLEDLTALEKAREREDAFEVAFEMAMSADRLRASAGEGDAEGVKGPMWKQLRGLGE